MIRDLIVLGLCKLAPLLGLSLFDLNKTGKDQRFNNSHRIGRVSELVVDDTQTSVRVAFPDKQNVISKPFPVCQTSGGARRSFNVPKVGQSVLCGMLANGDSDGFVIGTFYTTQDPPPISDPLRQYTEFADGTSFDFNEATSTLAINAKGPLNLVTSGPVSIKGSEVTIEAGNIKIVGQLRIEGDIEHQGNMQTSGTHQDSRGFHS